MSTLNENLNKIYECKQDIGRALTEKGVRVKGFETFADGIRSIGGEADKVRKLGACIMTFSLEKGTFNFYKNNKEIVQSDTHGTLVGLAFSDGNEVVVVNLSSINVPISLWTTPRTPISTDTFKLLLPFGSKHNKRYIYSDNLINTINNHMPSSYPLSNKECYLMDAETYTIVCEGLSRCEDREEILNMLPIKPNQSFFLANYVYMESVLCLLRVFADYTIPVDSSNLLPLNISSASDSLSMIICYKYPLVERT